MQSHATVSSAHEGNNTVSGDVQTHRDQKYHKAFDRRKRPIRGLWTRNGRFYARLTIEDPNTGRKQVRRVPLEGITTIPQAQAKLRRLQTRREDQELPALRRAPKFTDYAQGYLSYFEKVKDAKSPRTLATERVHLNAWTAHLGETRLNHITRAMINAFIEKRQAEGVSGRTVNLAVIVLRNVLKRAIEDNWIRSLPTENLRPLKWTARKKALVTLADIERLCEAALRVSKNGQEFSDYVRFMAFCGSRMTETMRIRWENVDWERRQLTIGFDGQTKNRLARMVDFNPNLEAHLKAMHQRRAPDTQWLFPSPQRGNQDISVRSFRETLRMARKEVGLPQFGFHDCRHFFISYCVMSGIDYMTIARWVGHQDGGILIGKVYGHLSNEDAQQQAQRVSFGPVVLDKVAP
jgi:integrase